VELDYKFDSEACWYNIICPEFGTESCANGCLRHLEMSHLMNNALIPKKLQKRHDLIPYEIDEPAFDLLNDVKKNIFEFVKNGENLYIFSETCGNGKTTWAIKLLQSYFDKVWYGNRFKTRGLYVNQSTFLVDLRKRMFKKEESSEDIENLIYSVDLVVWDDIGASNLKDFDFLNMYSIIDYRLANGLSNIYTSNLSQDDFVKSLGKKLYSRICKSSIAVEFKGDDRRGEC
jgi:DNA replication protein DnaC